MQHPLRPRLFNFPPLLDKFTSDRITRWIKDTCDAQDDGSISTSEEPPPKRLKREHCPCPEDLILPDMLMSNRLTPPMTIREKGQSLGEPTQSQTRGNYEVEDTNVDTTDGRNTPRLTRPDVRFLPWSLTKHTASPVKITDQLKSLETPVYHRQLTKKDFDNDPCLKDVEDLYSSIKKATYLRGIIPSELREDIEKLDREFQLEDDDLFQKVYEARFREPAADDEARARIRATFESLLNIQQQADECIELSRHESGWNNFVHAPLLSLVFKDRRTSPPTAAPPAVGTRLEAAMPATIQADSIPIMRYSKGLSRGVNAVTNAYVLTIEGTQISGDTTEHDRDTSMPMSLEAQTQPNVDLATAHSRSSAKQVDYVVVMDIFDETTGLKKRIEQLNWYNGDHFGAPPHVNHTAYKPIANSPIALSIETMRTVSPDEPLLRLGIWVAAWHKRMCYLRGVLAANTVGAAPEWFQTQLISVPLIQVVGHEWYLYFACFSNQITLYGPTRIGSTASLVELYTLVASLEAIREWIKTSFKNGIQEWFVCGASEDAPFSEVAVATPVHSAPEPALSRRDIMDSAKPACDHY